MRGDAIEGGRDEVGRGVSRLEKGEGEHERDDGEEEEEEERRCEEEFEATSSSDGVSAFCGKSLVVLFIVHGSFLSVRRSRERERASGWELKRQQKTTWGREMMEI